MSLCGISRAYCKPFPRGWAKVSEPLKVITGAVTGNLFRILVVDDNRAEAVFLREVMTNLQCRYELHFVWDGVDALDFLHRRGTFTDAPRPNLILLDIDMPRLGGVETLSAIKTDPELCVIPVIMFSSSLSPDDVRQSYQARANCYVPKPKSVERSEKLLQVVEAFWMDFAILPTFPERTPTPNQATDSKRKPNASRGAGYPIAKTSAEASIHAMPDSLESPVAKVVRKSGCEKQDHLLGEFGAAVRELLALHEEQFQAIIDGDSESSRFDLLIHMANETKNRAKYAYIRHVESHGCSTVNADQT